MTDTPTTMILTYRVRLQPTRQQRRALEAILEQQRQLYNAALEERILAWAKGVSIGENAQSKSLTEIRADDPAFAGVQRRIQRGTLKRLDRAYKAFFRRAKTGAGASSGFPKFKGREHFDGFGFDAPAQIKWDGRRLRFSGMCGGLRLSKRDMRRVPELTPETWKGVHFKRVGDRWQVTLQVETPIRESRAGLGKGDVGVDWGTSVLAALSTGETIANPRLRENAAKALLRHERKVARSKRGSKRRLKARRRKQAVERHIANQRRNRMDKLSKRLVTHFGFVAVEDLKVSTMMDAERPGETLPQFVKTRRNREALDAAPFMLRQMTAYKASRERCGFVAVDPKHTTQECFWCGGLHFKELSEPEHVCTAPGLYFNKRVPRKVNAARIILRRARSERAGNTTSSLIAQGSENGAGRGPAGEAKASNRSTGSGRPRNTSGCRKTAVDGSRPGKARTPLPHAPRTALMPRDQPP